MEKVELVKLFRPIRLVSNGTSIERSQPCEIAHSPHGSHISQGQLVPSRKRDEHHRFANGTGQGWALQSQPSGNRSLYFSQKTVPVGEEDMLCPDEQSETGVRVFAVQVQSLVDHYECRGTILLSCREFIPVH
jgi:hypothetical protein